MLPISNETVILQKELANFCRTGTDAPKTSIPAHVIRYKQLVSNTIQASLKNAYPLSRELVGKKRWKKMVTHFFQNHACQTAQIWLLPLEFYEYYKQTAFPFKKNYPCLPELLYFEWLKIDVFFMEDAPLPAFKDKGNLQKDVLVPNPEIKILALQYPIHTKKASAIIEQDKGQYFVSIHRDYVCKEVRFNDLSYPFVEILGAIHERETRFSDLLTMYVSKGGNKKEASKTIKNFILFALKNNLIVGFIK